jgi:hypothetical protein
MSPMPKRGNAAASTALPQPPSTSQKVPMNSAASFLVKGITDSCLYICDFRNGRLTRRRG